MFGIRPLVARLDSCRTLAARSLGLVTVVCCVLYAMTTLDRGWIPHDMGQLGHSAERVFHGEWQHRDFDEPYTGGLGCLNALAFHVWGVRAESMRLMLLAYFALYLVSVYAIARRVVRPGYASLVTMLCAGLSVPIYPEAMPSWYNLFFATFGTLALLQYIDTGRGRWLFWAGCCGGCSLVMKITGIYFVAAALMAIGYQRQCPAKRDEPVGRSFAWVTTVLCLAFAALGFLFVRGPRPVSNIVHFSIPLWGMAGFMVWREWCLGSGSFRTRMVTLATDWGVFLFGVAAVLLFFVIPYAASGSLGELWRGLFVLPAARLEHAALAPPEWKWLLLSLPAAVLVGAGIFQPQLRYRWLLPIVITVLAGIFAASGTTVGYFYVFQALRNLIPFVVVLGLLALVVRSDNCHQPALLLLIAVTATCSLIQYPYAYGTYFFYAAPLMVLTVLYLAAIQPRSWQRLQVALLIFALLFSCLRLPQPDPRLMNGFYAPALPVAAMGLPRCNLRVGQGDASVYRAVVSVVQHHSGTGEYIYAAPDCPELYFLSGRKNATRTLYDFFDQSDKSDKNRADRLLKTLQSKAVRVVVINRRPAFSRPIQEPIESRLERHYPQSESIFGAAYPGGPRQELFRVMWRTPPTPGHPSDAGRKKTQVLGATDASTLRPYCVAHRLPVFAPRTNVPMAPVVAKPVTTECEL